MIVIKYKNLFLACEKLASIVCNGTMVDLLKLFVEKYQLNYSYHDAAKDTLNVGGGSDLVINPHSYKIDRFMNFSYGFPFMTTPEYIFTRKPEVEVSNECFLW